MRVIVLVDGEHYPPVTRWGIEHARDRGLEPVAALLLGGTEKLRPGELPDLGIPVHRAGDDPREALSVLVGEREVGGVLDLSDEPVLGYRERLELASVALSRGLVYLGPDLRLDPPLEGPMLEAPTVAVFGVGKRTGKTAIAGEVARTAASGGRDPVVVAMGRGGPPEPQVAPAGSVGLDRLLELVRGGEHAASDYLEHAITTGLTTVGARRVGGGLGGRPYATNVREAAELASTLGGLVVMDGSGAALPTVPWDTGVLVVPASLPSEYLGGYLGPLRLLLSDLVVVTMGRSPAGLENLPILRSHVERLRGDARLIVTDLQPWPLGDVRGRDVFFTTTAPRVTAEAQSRALEENHGCRVVGWSDRLADRAGLAQDLDGAEGYEVLLTELKAAAVDVACDRALAAGAEVTFVDNRPVLVEGDADLPSALMETIGRAEERRSRR